MFGWSPVRITVWFVPNVESRVVNVPQAVVRPYSTLVELASPLVVHVIVAPLEIYDAMAKEICVLKGTISAEHGIGKMKKKYLKYMYPEEAINAMKQIKKIFDPELRLNRGNIFDVE